MIMTDSNCIVSRRDFLKTAAGAAAMIGALSNPATASQHQAGMPTRPFGRTGIDVPILSLGGMFNIASNQMLMKQAMNWGVTYWDTADCYQRGSENGIGKYFKKDLPTPRPNSWLFGITRRLPVSVHRCRI